MLKNKVCLLFYLYLYNGIQYSRDEWDYHYEKTGQVGNWSSVSFAYQLNFPMSASDPNYKRWTKDGWRKVD